MLKKVAGCVFLFSWVAGSAPPVFRNAVSVSPFTEVMFAGGLTYSDGKATATTPEELERIFMAHGANELFARIATTRRYRIGFGDQSLIRGLERARLAKLLGLPFNPELSLFDVNGDIRCQPAPDFREYPELRLPGPWPSLSMQQIAAVLRSYGAMVAREILDTGVRVRIWDLGNEVEFGSAGIAPRPIPGACDDTEGSARWYQPPDRVDTAIGKMSVPELMRMPEADRIAWLRAHLWPYLASVFAATAEGIRSVEHSARFSTHVSGITGVRPAQAVAFYQAMRAGGFDANELGFSFYPSSSDQPPHRLQTFQQTLERVGRELKRPVFIAEFGYPASQIGEGGYAGWNHPARGYPLTPEGQAKLLRDLTVWGIRNGLSGIRPWAPDLVVPVWEPMSLFSRDGKSAHARPSVGAIAGGLAAHR